MARDLLSHRIFVSERGFGGYSDPEVGTGRLRLVVGSLRGGAGAGISLYSTNCSASLTDSATLTSNCAVSGGGVSGCSTKRVSTARSIAQSVSWSPEVIDDGVPLNAVINKVSTASSRDGDLEVGAEAVPAAEG